MCRFVIGLAVLFLADSRSSADIHMILDDEFDNFRLVLDAQERPEVQAARAKLDEFTKGLLRLKERDFIALFGKPRAMPPETHAMPIAQGRGLSLSGLRYIDPAMNKDHTEIYAVPGVARLAVFYQLDGESPAAILLYFPADQDCPKLTKDNLGQRLAWDANHLDRLKAYTAGRLELVFPWEVDRAELAFLESGDYEAHAGRKLAAWIASGPVLGYTYRHIEGSNDWTWYGPDGRPTRRASRSPGAGGHPVYFEWLRPNGHPYREEWFDHPTGELRTRRWTGGGGNIRYEGRDSWCWYGKAGKPVRLEWDDNGDGIPDWYVTADDGLRHCADREAMEKRKALAVHASWAVRPELIPAESRISDQPGLRLPVRRHEATARGPAAGPDAVALGSDSGLPARLAAPGARTAGRTGDDGRGTASRWTVGIPAAVTAVGLAALLCARREARSAPAECRGTRRCTGHRLRDGFKLSGRSPSGP